MAPAHTNSLLPNELLFSISRQWMCRDAQITQLFGLLNPSTSSPSAIVVHGPKDSGKSAILGALLEQLRDFAGADEYADVNRFTNGNVDIGREDKPQGIPHTIVKCAECITARHLLSQIVSSSITTLREWSSTSIADEEWADLLSKLKCEHISLLAGQLDQALKRARCEKFVLVLDGVDALREGGQMLLAGLARVGELIPCLSIVFVVKSTPRPLLLQVAGVPHVYFPPYSRNEAIYILAASRPPEVSGLPLATAVKIYPQFISTLYDSLIGPTTGTISTFRGACERLWPRFVAPIINHEKPPGNSRAEWDFSRLLVKNRALFQHQGEEVLVHRIISDDSSATTSSQPLAKKTSSTLPSLPYLATLVLTSAYLAAHIPSRNDIIFFSKYSSQSTRKKRAYQRKRIKMMSQGPSHSQDADQDLDDATSTPTKSGRKRKVGASNSNTAGGSSTLPTPRAGASYLTPRPFPLERLLAIYRAIDPNPPPPSSTASSAKPYADLIYPELATLHRLRLVVPAGAAASSGADGAEKWCLNSSVAVSGYGGGMGGVGGPQGEWIVEMARGVGVEIEEWLMGE